MRRFLPLLAVLMVAALAMTGCGPSITGDAKKTGAAFLAAAAARDSETVQSLLSPSADVTARQVVESYQGLAATEAFDVVKALPNQTGVEFLVLASGVDRGGRPHSTTIAVGRENGLWRVIRVGDHITY